MHVLVHGYTFSNIIPWFLVNFPIVKENQLLIQSSNKHKVMLLWKPIQTNEKAWQIMSKYCQVNFRPCR